MRIGVKIQPFNHTMRTARKEMGLTQVQLAELIGCHQQVISKMERFVLEKWVCKYIPEVALILGIEEMDLFPEEIRGPEARRLLKAREIVVEPAGLLEVEPAFYLLPDECSLDRAKLQEALDEMLRDLPIRERKVIELHFGIGQEEKLTFEEIAPLFGVTGERIRQIEQNGLRKLRHPLRTRKLRTYLE